MHGRPRSAETGSSALLAEVLAASGQVTAADVAAAADRRGGAAQSLLVRAGHLVGATLATLVTFHNPARTVLGGEYSGPAISC